MPTSGLLSTAAFTSAGTELATVVMDADFRKFLRVIIQVSLVETGAMIAIQLMQTHSLPNWPHPLSGDHLTGIGRLAEANASLLMLI
jgi:hypothetical protein